MGGLHFGDVPVLWEGKGEEGGGGRGCWCENVCLCDNHFATWAQPSFQSVSHTSVPCCRISRCESLPAFLPSPAPFIPLCLCFRKSSPPVNSTHCCQMTRGSLCLPVCHIKDATLLPFSCHNSVPLSPFLWSAVFTCSTWYCGTVHGSTEGALTT